MRRWSDLPRWLRSGAVLLLLLAIGMGGIRYCEIAGRTFDAERWQSAAPGTHIRGRMAPDIIASRRLIGMTREAVIALLGEPQRLSGGRLQYNLGLPEQGYGIDDDMLDITLDKTGRVTDVQIYSS